MLRREKIIFRVIVSAVLIIGISIAAVVGVHTVKETLAARRDAEYKELTADLVLERARLQIEYTAVEQEAVETLPQESAAVLLFLEIDSTLYDSMYVEFGIGGTLFPAVMCFSETDLPGLEGKITAEQYEIMTNDGWSEALYWNGEGELSDFIDTMRTRLAELEIDMPDTMVFAPKSYKLDYDELLSENGILHAVHHGEENLSLVDTSVNTPVRHPGTVGWNEIQQQKLYHNTLVNMGGVGAYSFSFSDGSLSSYFDPTNEDLVSSFKRMMAYLGQYEDTEVKITDFAGAWATRKEYNDRIEEMTEDVSAKQARLLARINEINEELVNIYNEVYGG